MKGANGAAGESGTRGSTDPGERPSRPDVLSFLDRSMGGLADRMAAISSGAAPPPAEPPPTPQPMPLTEPRPLDEPVPAPEQKAPSAEAAEPEPAPEGPPVADDYRILPEAVTGWATEVELLYSDLLRLFALGDTDGALVSLERLLVIAPADEQITSFLEVNEAKLTKLYEGVMGPWSNVPSRVGAPEAPAFYSRHQKFKAVLHLIDGKRDISSILEESFFQKIETCALLDQLIRAKLVLPHDV